MFIAALNNPEYFPYRYGHALWAFIGGKYGDRAVASLLRAGSVARDYREAFEAVLLGVIEGLTGEFRKTRPSYDTRIQDADLPQVRDIAGWTKVTDVLHEGDEVVVKVLNIDPTGKIRLSRKAAFGVDPSEVQNMRG